MVGGNSPRHAEFREKKAAIIMGMGKKNEDTAALQHLVANFCLPVVAATELIAVNP